MDTAETAVKALCWQAWLCFFVLSHERKLSPESNTQDPEADMARRIAYRHSRGQNQSQHAMRRAMLLCAAEG